MKKLISGVLFSTLTSTLMAFTSHENAYVTGTVIEMEGESYQVAPLSEMTQDQAENFFAGNTPFIVLKCEQGSNFPFNFSLTGEFLSVNSGEAPQTIQTIQILKTCYVKCLKKTAFFSGETTGYTLLFSTNLQDWKNFDEFFTATVGVFIQAKDEAKLVQFNLELNQRN